MPDDFGERSEEPTPKRIQDAREEGNVAKSTDAAGAMMLLGVSIVLWLLLTPSLGRLAVMVETMLGPASRDSIVDPASAAELGSSALGWLMRVGGPILLVAWLVGYVSHFWQVGWLFTPKAVQPRLSKINPMNGFKRIFGITGIVRAAMDGGKVLVVMTIAVLTIVQKKEEIVLLPNLEPLGGLAKVGWMMFDLALRIIAVLLVLGLLDLAWQRWKHRRDLRMTKVEVREELKQTEGDPETRKRRMRMQQQIAMQRVSAAVPRADVVVTNPEHISVAIAYEAERMAAPKVVAKGQDHLALRIRQIALKHGVPIVERKPLARALYRQVKVGQEVPPEFYQAVAEILAYVYRLSGRRAG